MGPHGGSYLPRLHHKITVHTDHNTSPASGRPLNVLNASNKHSEKATK